MEIGICSFSFHRLLAAGKQDIFRYIKDCAELGCTQLDPWNAHLSAVRSGEEVLRAGRNPDRSQHLSALDEEYITRVKQAADATGLPFGCICVDGAHIYEESADDRAANRVRALSWLDVASKLGAKQVRIDSGGPEGELPEDVFAIIKEGYAEVIAYASALGLQVLVENHWGPTLVVEHVIRMVEEIPGLGLLLDTHNFRADARVEARKRCAKYASMTHVKTLNWDADGNETGDHAAEAIQSLMDGGYKGVWGVESTPRDGDEYGGARRAVDLVRRTVIA